MSERFRASFEDEYIMRGYEHVSENMCIGVVKHIRIVAHHPEPTR